MKWHKQIYDVAIFWTQNTQKYIVSDVLPKNIYLLGSTQISAFRLFRVSTPACVGICLTRVSDTRVCLITLHVGSGGSQTPACEYRDNVAGICLSGIISYFDVVFGVFIQ